MLKWMQSGCKADTSSGGDQVDARTGPKYWMVADIKLISKAEASGDSGGESWRIK